jgi:hypothetical protein
MCCITNISSPMYPGSPNKYSKYSYVWTKCWHQFVWMFDYHKILMSWNDLGYPRSKYMNNPWWSTTIVLFMQYIFFHPLNQPRWAKLFQGLWIFMRVPSNKSNATLELWKLCNQDPMLLNSGPLDLIDNGEIDARCNKDAIIIYCTLVPIP